MDIDELLIVLEKNRSKLTKLEDDFYQQIRKRISELEKLRREADDYEASRIDDEIRTIKRIQRKIFETRTSKIIRAAWAKVCGEAVSVENLTSAERDLLTKLTDLISEFRDVLTGEVSPEGENTNAQANEGYGKNSRDYELIRVKTNIGKFEGVDGKTYKLSREDVVTLPKLNAKALIKADAAEPITWGDEQ
jgi:DNA replication factor GINS